MELYVTILALNLLLSCSAAPIMEDKNPEDIGEYGEYFEGDMMLTTKQHKAIETAVKTNRNGLRSVTKRWPENTVVYFIEVDDFDEEHIANITDALSDIANNSCIKFRPRKHIDEHAVIIQGSQSGCFSNVGYIHPDHDDDSEEDMKQVLNLAKGCFKHGTIIHEMLHTLGFYHMQSTYDRDDYVTIVWENIISGHEHNFVKHSNDTVTDFGVPYDYGSVMHYSGTAFSKNGNHTIEPKQENVILGQRMGMSESDVMKLKRMYCEKEEETVEVHTVENNNNLISTLLNILTPHHSPVSA